MRSPLLLLTASCFLVGPAVAGPPPEDQCPTISGPLGPGVSDAVPRRLARGQRLGYDSLLALRELLPHEVWQNRHVFFFPGMQMVIGDCHRRYRVPEFFSAATERYAGRAETDGEGNLRGYVAGLPIPPETIDPGTPPRPTAARRAIRSSTQPSSASPTRATRERRSTTSAPRSASAGSLCCTTSAVKKRCTARCSRAFCPTGWRG